MPRDPKITPNIKRRLDRLEPKLKKCVKTGNLRVAKIIMKDIQDVLTQGNYNSRLMKNKNFFFETALEAGEIDYAIMGLKGVKQKISNT